MVTEHRVFDGGNRRGHIVIRVGILGLSSMTLTYGLTIVNFYALKNITYLIGKS